MKLFLLLIALVFPGEKNYSFSFKEKPTAREIENAEVLAT